MTKKRLLLLATLSIAALSGCGGGIALKSSAPAPTYYRLNPLPPQEVLANLPVSIILEEPRLASGLATDRIARVRQDGRILDHYAGGRWPAPLDKVLHDFMIESVGPSFTLSPRRARSIQSNLGHYRILIFFTDFEAVYEGDATQTPDVLVSFTVTALDQMTGDVADKFTISKQGTATANTLTDVTYALQETLRAGTLDMLARLQSSLSREAPSTAAKAAR